MSVTSNRGSNDTTRPARQVKRLSVEETAREIRERRAILTTGKTGRVVIWAPHTYIPMHLRQAVAAHNQELRRLINRSDVRTCTNPDLHRSSWSYQNRRYCCDQCARLLPEVS